MTRTRRSLPVIVSPVYLNGTAVMRAFARQGARCVAVSSDPKVSGFISRCASERVLLPNIAKHPGVLADWLLSRQDLAGALVVPTGDEVVSELHHHRPALSAMFRLAIPPPLACEVTLDKYRQAEVCRAAAIPAPRTIKIEHSTDLSTAGGLGFPVIVKPCYGIDFQRLLSSKLSLAHDAAGLEEVAEHCRRHAFPAILQEPLPADGRTAAYNAYVDRAGRIVGDFSSLRLGAFPPSFGVGYFEVAERIEPVLRLGRRFIEAVGYSGALVNIDFKEDPRDGLFKLLDFNARSWRQISLARLAGLDVAGAILADYVDAVDPPKARIRYGARWLYLKDALQLRRSYPSECPSAWSYLKCLWMPTSPGLFDMLDPRPSIGDIAPMLARRLYAFGRWQKRD